MSQGPRAALISWPGVDWSLLSASLDAGALPCLRGLIERGSLATPSVPGWGNAAALHTTLITGRPPRAHNVLLDFDLDERTGALRPATGRERRVPALWDLLSPAERRSLVINWPANFPVAPLRGAAVAGEAWRPGLRRSAPPPGSVHPRELGDSLSPALFALHELEAEDLLPFLPALPRLSPSDSRLGAFSAALARAISLHAVATSWLAEQKWDFFAASYDLAATAQWLAALPVGEPPARPDGAFAAAPAGALGFTDQMLGRLLELIGPDAAVFVIGVPRPDETGFCVLAGPDARRDELLPQCDWLDIAPTLLWRLGLPIPEEWPGRALAEAYAHIEAPPRRVRSQFSSLAPSPDPPETAAAALSALTALGYSDPFAAPAARARAQWLAARGRALATLADPSEAHP